MPAPTGVLTAIGDFDGTTPKAPIVDVAEGRTGGLNLAWHLPDEVAAADADPDVAPRGFRAVVEAVDGTEPARTYDLFSNDRSLAVSGLRLEAAYRVRLWTVTRTGVSAPTAVDISTKNFEPPPAPAIVGTSIDATSLDVTVGPDPHAYIGETADPLDHYELRMVRNGQVANRSVAPADAGYIRAADLSPDTDYLAQLYAVGTHGVVSDPATVAVRTLKPPAPAITTVSMARASIGIAYTATLTATGGTTPYAWSVASGNLPNGLTLSPAGFLSGTPTRGGSASFTVRLTDSSSPAFETTRAFIINVAPIAVATTTLPAGVVGKPYQSTLTAFGGTGAVQWSVRSGALPAGVTLSAVGQLSGNPTAAGTFRVTVQAEDSATRPHVAVKGLTLRVAPIGVATSNVPDGVVGASYSGSLSAYGGVGALTWSKSGPLPPGIRMSTTGVLSGIPSTAGIYTFTARVTDSASPAHTAKSTVTITVAGTSR